MSIHDYIYSKKCNLNVSSTHSFKTCTISTLVPYAVCFNVVCMAIEWRNRFRKKTFFSIEKKVYVVWLSQFSAFLRKEWNCSRLFLLHWHLKYLIGLHLLHLTWNFPLFHWEFQTNWNLTIKKKSKHCQCFIRTIYILFVDSFCAINRAAKARTLWFLCTY